MRERRPVDEGEAETIAELRRPLHAVENDLPGNGATVVSHGVVVQRQHDGSACSRCVD